MHASLRCQQSVRTDTAINILQTTMQVMNQEQPCSFLTLVTGENLVSRLVGCFCEEQL